MTATLLQRVTRHLREGTLPDRLRFRLERYRDRKREAWWKAHRGEARSFVYEFQPGLSINLYLDSELCRLIYCAHFESIERAFVNRFLRSGDTFIDVGANIGLFALIAANRVGKRGRVFAFEPTPATFLRLEENVRTNLFENVECLRVALSDRAGELEITESLDGFDAWNSLTRPTMGNEFGKAIVTATTWDAFVRERDLGDSVTMMKIDVEGWESRVLAGGRETLSRPDAPVLQVEFTDDAALASGGSCADLYRSLEALGYRMYVPDATGTRMVHDPLRERYPYANLIAAKNIDAVNDRLHEAGRA